MKKHPFPSNRPSQWYLYLDDISTYRSPPLHPSLPQLVISNLVTTPFSGMPRFTIRKRRRSRSEPCNQTPNPKKTVRANKKNKISSKTRVDEVNSEPPQDISNVTTTPNNHSLSPRESGDIPSQRSSDEDAVSLLKSSQTVHVVSQIQTEEIQKETEEIQRIAREDAKLDPSPNKKTRSQRASLNGVKCEDNTVERRRIARIILECDPAKNIPCSVYGCDRYRKYPAFFFCNECHKADTEEGWRPGSFINRQAKNGRYTCTAEHTSFSEPTQLNPKSRFYPTPPPSNLFCVPIEDRTPPPPSPRKSSSTIHSPHRFHNVVFNSGFASPGLAQVDLQSRQVPKAAESLDDSTFKYPEDPSSHEDDDIHNIPDDESRDDLPLWPLDDDGDEELDDLEPFEETVISPVIISEQVNATTQSSSPHQDTDSNTTCDEQRETDQTTRLMQKLEDLTKALNVTKNKLTDCREKLKQRNDDVLYWRNKRMDQAGSCLPKSCYKDKDRKKLLEHFRFVLESRTKNMEPTSRAASEFYRDVANLCLDKSVHSGLLFESSYTAFRKYLRDNVFTPFNILKRMDLAGGRLNFGGIEVLRSVETDGISHTRTILPSTSALQECAKAIEQFGSKLFPYKLMRHKEDGSEGFSFRASDVMSGILVASGCLHGDAQWGPIRLAQSLDGALFTKNLSHTLGGLKFNDPSNPFAQSRNSCFPLVCICRPESKGLVRSVFRNMIQEIREGARTVLPTKFGVWPLQICTNCDMSCEWKLLGRGGAAQQATFPCSKCTVRSGELHLPTNKPSECSLCKQLGHHLKENWTCYHHSMCTDEHLESLKEEVRQFKKDMPEIQAGLKRIWADSTLCMQEDPRSVPSDFQKGSIDSIHFDLERASLVQRQEYARTLTNDLVARRLDLTGTLEDRQARLKSSHVREWEYYQANRVLEDFAESSHSTAMVYLLDTVPCILHMENRIGIKILTMCLKKGLEHASNDELEWIDEDDRRSGIVKRCSALINSVNKVMSQDILGRKEFPSQWKAPYDENKRELSPITMDNVRIRKVLPAFKKIISLCIDSEMKRRLWTTCVSDYVESMELLNNKRDMTQQEIEAYQRKADEFFVTWVKLTGEHGVTNYAHLIGSGHVYQYLLHWKNLAAHAQQGWEGEYPFLFLMLCTPKIGSNHSV